MSDVARAARALLRSVDAGVLSTHSAVVEGYPFGSLTPYVLSVVGRAVIYISGIAQHTKNLVAREQACLTVYDASERGDKQARGRVSILGNGVLVPESERERIAARYFELFPASRAHEKTHDFAFYWIDPVRVRYIGGFGEIHWIERDDWLLDSPEWLGAEAGVCQHMNDDHTDSMVNMCRHFAGRDVADAELVGIDPEGFHVRADEEIVYLAFGGRAVTTDDLHREMVQLSRTARGAP